MNVVVTIGKFCSARTNLSAGVEIEVHESDLSRVAWALEHAARQLKNVEKGLAVLESNIKRTDQDSDE